MISPFPICHWSGGGAAFVQTLVQHDGLDDLQPDADYDVIRSTEGWRLSKVLTAAGHFKFDGALTSISNDQVFEDSNSQIDLRGLNETGGGEHDYRILVFWRVWNTNSDGSLRFTGGNPEFSFIRAISHTNPPANGADVWHNYVVSIQQSITSFSTTINVWIDGVAQAVKNTNGAALTQWRGYLSFIDTNTLIVGNFSDVCLYDTWFNPTTYVTDPTKFLPAGSLGKQGELVQDGRPAYFHSGSFNQWNVNRGDAGLIEATPPVHTPCGAPAFPTDGGPLAFAKKRI